MKKVVKLTESDLINIIKKVVKEQSSLTTPSTTTNNLSDRRKKCCTPQRREDGSCNADCHWLETLNGSCYCYATHLK